MYELGTFFQTQSHVRHMSTVSILTKQTTHTFHSNNMIILTLVTIRRWQQYSIESEEEQKYYICGQVEPVYPSPI